MTELTRTTIKDKKIIFGEIELANLVNTLIHIYRFNSKNETPEAVVLPYVAEVEGVRIEYPKAKRPANQTGNTDG